MSGFTANVLSCGQQMVNGTCLKNFLNMRSNSKLSVAIKVAVVAIAAGLATKFIPPIIFPVALGVAAFAYLTAHPPRQPMPAVANPQ